MISMPSSNYLYIASEQFIHDDLVARSDQMIEKLYDIWRDHKGIPSFAHAWSAESVPTVDGKRVNEVTTYLPNDDAKAARNQVLLLLERSKAYGMLIVDSSDPEEIRAYFESMHGSKTWRIGIKHHGDTKVLSRPTTLIDSGELGLLWKKKIAKA